MLLCLRRIVTGSCAQQRFQQHVTKAETTEKRPRETSVLADNISKPNVVEVKY